jgi:hypothetical protein
VLSGEATKELRVLSLPICFGGELAAVSQEALKSERSTLQ